MTPTAQLTVGAVWTRITAGMAVLRALDPVLSAADPAARFSPAYQRGTWDGVRHFLRRGAFLTGLVPRVRKVLRQGGVEVQVKVAGRVAPPGEPWSPHLLDAQGLPLELRGYQMEGVLQAIARKRLSVQVPTGGGKTLLGAEYIRRLARPTLWLIHRKDLLHQTHAVLEQALGRPVGRYGDGHHTMGDVVVGSVQTLMRVLDPEFWALWQALVVDECQHASTDTWSEAAERCTGAWYRLALSGTIETGHPVRDLLREGVVGPMYTAATAVQLIDAGHLARPEIIMLQVGEDCYPTYEEVRETVHPAWRDNPRSLSRMGAKLFAEAYTAGIVCNEIRNDALAELAIEHVEQGDRVLVLVVRTEHGKILENLIPGSAWIYGKDDATTRLRVKEWLAKAPNGACVIASDIWREGVDIPEINTLIMAGGGASTNATLQRLGRALRPKPGGGTVTVYDVQDGYADARKDYLRDHSLQRLQDYQREGYTVNTLTISTS